jgi:hypothetical protein
MTIGIVHPDNGSFGGLEYAKLVGQGQYLATHPVFPVLGLTIVDFAHLEHPIPASVYYNARV